MVDQADVLSAVRPEDLAIPAQQERVELKGNLDPAMADAMRAVAEENPTEVLTVMGYGLKRANEISKTTDEAAGEMMELSADFLNSVKATKNEKNRYALSQDQKQQLKQFFQEKSQTEEGRQEVVDYIKALKSQPGSEYKAAANSLVFHMAHWEARILKEEWKGKASEKSSQDPNSQPEVQESVSSTEQHDTAEKPLDNQSVVEKVQRTQEEIRQQYEQAQKILGDFIKENDERKRKEYVRQFKIDQRALEILNHKPGDLTESDLQDLQAEILRVGLDSAHQAMVGDDKIKTTYFREKTDSVVVMAKMLQKFKEVSQQFIEKDPEKAREILLSLFDKVNPPETRGYTPTTDGLISWMNSVYRTADQDLTQYVRQVTYAFSVKR